MAPICIAILLRDYLGQGSLEHPQLTDSEAVAPKQCHKMKGRSKIPWDKNGLSQRIWCTNSDFYGIQTPTLVAYEPRLLCHMSRFHWGWGWSSLCWFSTSIIGELQRWERAHVGFAGTGRKRKRPCMKQCAWRKHGLCDTRLAEACSPQQDTKEYLNQRGT